MRLLADLRVFILIGTIWGFLASAFYERVTLVWFSRFPLLFIGGFLALTVLLPGCVGRIIAVRVFGTPIPMPTFSPQVESLATIVSMLVGMLILFVIWRLRKARLSR